MTRISCEVKKCMYNKDGGCRLEAIEVGTENARMTDETRCESYAPGDDAPTNSTSCHSDACDISNIECSAENCVYNDGGYCEADKIRISNCISCKCGETECDTFKPE